MTPNFLTQVYVTEVDANRRRRNDDANEAISKRTSVLHCVPENDRCCTELPDSLLHHCQLVLRYAFGTGRYWTLDRSRQHHRRGEYEASGTAKLRDQERRWQPAVPEVSSVRVHGPADADLLPGAAGTCEVPRLLVRVPGLTEEPGSPRRHGPSNAA